MGLLIGLIPVVSLRLFTIDEWIDKEYAIYQAQKFFLDLVVCKLIQRIHILQMLFKSIKSVLLERYY
jgi:hypothetical protein